MYLSEVSQQRDALYGLAKAHLISQNAIDALVIEVGQPIHTLQLVGLQSTVEHLWLGELAVTVQHWSGQAEFLVDCGGREGEEGGRGGRERREGEEGGRCQ